MCKEKSAIFCQGRVKFYDAQKNQFGFIEVKKSENQTIKDDIYFKESALRDSSAVPRDGVSIYCYAQKGKKGYFGKEVIKKNELTQSERLQYIEFLHVNDLIQLINDISEGNLLRSDSEIAPILEAAMNHYKTLNSVIWEFIYRYGDRDQKAILSSYISRLNLKQKLRLSTVSDELLEQIVSNFSSNETLELVDYLVENNHLKYISDDLWIEYLNHRKSPKENIFTVLKSNLKEDLTLKHLSWSVKDVFDLFEYFNITETKIDEDFLRSLFHKHYVNFSFSKNSYRNKLDTYIKFIERVFNQNLSSSFITDFTQINLELIHQKPFNEALSLISEIREASQEDTSEHLSDFYRSLQNAFKSNLPDKIEKLDESIIIDNYWSLKELDLSEKVVQHLSRLSVIKLSIRDHSIDIDFTEDYKYLDQVEFEVQRHFIFELSKTAKDDEGRQFWAIINKLRVDIFESNNLSYDPSTVFILYLLTQLEDKDTLDNNALSASDFFEFVYTKLIDESLIEHKLQGYFDHCSGRAFAQEYSSNEFTVKRTKNEPCQYCEGKLMTNTKTGKPAIDTRTNKKKYWCRNSICLSPSRQEEDNNRHLFSGILKNIGYSNIDYFIGFVNGWVNKINRYLDHLQCRNCNKALIPKDVGNGYYRVSHFYCNNSECEKYGEDNSVYITHCINNKCEELIDSRDSSQCKNNWYICIHCLGCCSTEKIQKRIEYHSHSNSTYSGPTLGHKEEGKLYCPDCGNFITSKNNGSIYNNMLNKFKRLKTQHPNVIKWGQRDIDNKYWFLLKKSPNSTYDDFDDNISKLNKLGFNIAEDYVHGQEIALISEKFSNSEITCTNCEFSLSTKKLYKEGDFYRAKAIEEWHNEIFN